MIRSIQKFTSVTIAALIFFGIMMIYSGQSFAASGKWEFMIGDDCYAGNPMFHNVEVLNTKNYEQYATVTKATSSNPKVVKIYKERWDGKTHYQMLFKKVGKATITVKYKTPNGKKGTVKKTIKVKKAPIVFKSIQINGKKVSTKKNIFKYEDFKYKKKSLKIKVKPAKGWKIEDASVVAANWRNGKRKDIKVSKNTFVKGKTIKRPKGYNWSDINIQMTNGDQYFNYYIGLGTSNS